MSWKSWILTGEEEEKKEKSKVQKPPKKLKSKYNSLFLIILIIGIVWFNISIWSGDSKIEECEYEAEDCYDDCFYYYGMYGDRYYLYFDCEEECEIEYDDCIDDAKGWFG